MPFDKGLPAPIVKWIDSVDLCRQLIALDIERSEAPGELDKKMPDICLRKQKTGGYVAVSLLIEEKMNQ